MIDDTDKEHINVILEYIKFGMSNTLIDFDGQYYEYDGGKEMNERGLTICGYESAYLADMVIAYILVIIEDESCSLFPKLDYFKIYRDDGLALFKGKPLNNRHY